MDTRQIQYFLELIKYENISKTADILNISQSALSKSISSLEREVGVRLFDHTGNRISLNTNGKTFARHAAQAYKEIEKGLFVVNQSRFDICGEIQIVTYAYPSILAPMIAEYAELNPKVSVSIRRHGDSNEGPENRSDFLLCSDGVRKDLAKSGSWETTKLFEERNVLVVHPSYRSFPDDIDTIDLIDFHDADFIGMKDSNLFFRDITFRLCNAAGFMPHIKFDTNDHISKIRLLGSGRAVAILPECAARIASELYPEIRLFYIKNDSEKRSLYLLKQKCVVNEEVEDFWEFARHYYTSGANP